MEPFQSSYRSQTLTLSQLSIKCMAQLCRCHDHEENTNNHLLLGENWSGWSRVNHKPQVSKSTVKCALHHHELRGCSRHAVLKLDRSLLLIAWTEKKKTWRKNLWSDVTKIEWFGHNQQQYVWRQEGEAFNPKNYCQARCWLYYAAAITLGLRCSWVFQQDNDPKHTLKVVKECLNQARI